MERRRERVVRGLLLITLTLLLLCNIFVFPPLNGTKKSSDEKEEYFTTGGDSLNSQKSHSGAENKVKDVQNKDSEAKNKNESDELESARQTNKLRLQHLKRACDEVGNSSRFHAQTVKSFPSFWFQRLTRIQDYNFVQVESLLSQPRSLASLQVRLDQQLKSCCPKIPNNWKCLKWHIMTNDHRVFKPCTP